ncbi:MAG: hypothetical protein JF597_00945 [Streptomyces sp.]|uniref:baeRF2 domain-containing protein n=1 Tax=Streptomyces sp. TaxID=1931 RepID=UPI0025D347C8|nr:hypothetical protein [Streptomyces sp.]MBW8792205.1 hypothetical protein [Streptomyces sp.]
MDLRDLSDVLIADGPFVTVLVESESAVEKPADKYELVWKDVSRELIDKGLDGATVDAVLSAKGTHGEGNARLVVAVVDDHQVKLAMSLRHAPRQPIVDVAPLPHLLPLVEELSQRVPYVLVKADRAGATIEAWREAGEKAREVSGTADTGWGPDPRGPSKWQHTAHQHELESGWIGDIASDIAQTVSRLASEVKPELVIGVGDQRELKAIEEHLPGDLRPKWATVEGGRGEDGGEGLVRKRVSDLLHRHTAAKTLTELEDYSQERGQLKRAVDGVGPVVAALQKAQVQTLLVTTDAPTEGVLWFGPEPAQVGNSPEELAAIGVPMPSSGPVVDVLLRAAIGTGADVSLVPHEIELAPHGGVGALLRYADELGQ